MARIKTTDISLEYEIFGAKHANTVILIQGLGMQLIDWPETLISTLSKSFQVIIFDNRDSGLSSKIPHPEAQQEPYLHDMSECDVSKSLYNLHDLAEDVINLANTLKVDAFHLIGFSMGGMIAQLLAAKFPTRILSLVSLLSSGGQANMRSTPDATKRMNISCHRTNLSDAIDAAVISDAIFSGRKNICDPYQSKAAARKAILRSYCPEGTYRQGLAIRSTASRQSLLTQITAPTLIIHGEEDPCIHWQQAAEAHNLIKGSQFWLVKDLGHDFPDWFIRKLIPSLLNFLDKSTN
ncbi:MAG: alpha/beta fold hydrolase [Marinomonas foliarum]|uniref:alpha/beta fold hydrolase n=1 Tax=Marinomonas foliarum TaxID=491950 RepID=UPI003F95A44C